MEMVVGKVKQNLVQKLYLNDPRTGREVQATVHSWTTKGASGSARNEHIAKLAAEFVQKQMGVDAFTCTVRPETTKPGVAHESYRRHLWEVTQK